MGRSCCVPGCTSNYGNAPHITIFKFPKEKSLKEKWIKSIRRANFEVNSKTVVCVKHFEPKFVVREDIFPVIDGEPIRVPRKIPKLTNDAYPTIFTNIPSDVTVRLSNDGNKRLKRVMERDEIFNERCEEDGITCFDSFASEVKTRQTSCLQMLGDAMHESAKEENKILVFDKICRLCLVDEEELYPLFEQKLQSKLKTLAFDLQMKEGDELPQQACKQCVQHINSSYYFKLQCKRSHTSLMHQLNTVREELHAEKEQCFETFETENTKSNGEENISTEERMQDAVSSTNFEEEMTQQKTVDSEECMDEEYDTTDEELSDMQDALQESNKFPCKSIPKRFPISVSEIEGMSDNALSQNEETLEMFVSSEVGFDKKTLLRHKLTLLPRIHTCDICGRSFRTKGTLKQHKKCHQGNKTAYQCEYCSKIYQNAAKLREHISGVHAEKKPYSCNLCGREFPYKSTLKTHIRVHTGEKPFKCETCGKEFGQKHNLEDHRVVHTDERPHECQVCGNKYRQIRNLKIHMELHSDMPRKPKPIKRWCEFCGRGFNAVASFQRHLMTHTGEKPFTCEFCQKQFATKAKMLDHRRTHTNERPFRCPKCDKTFKVKEVMTKHLILQHESDTNKFSCDTCGLSFSRLSFLRKHIRSVHYEERHYSCPICHQIYFQKNYISLHVKNVHRLDLETLKLEQDDGKEN